MATYRTLCRRARKWADLGRDQRTWYHGARSVLRGIAELEGWDYGTFADIVAITSPRCSVSRNLKVAVAAMVGEVPGDVIRSTRAALAHYRATGIIRGPKTRRFSDVLRGDDGVVVIDTWMARGLGVADNKARNKTTQILGERIIGHVARAEGWTLADTQAAVWAGIILTHYKAGKVPGYNVRDVGLYTVDGSVSYTPF